MMACMPTRKQASLLDDAQAEHGMIATCPSSSVQPCQAPLPHCSSVSFASDLPCNQSPHLQDDEQVEDTADPQHLSDEARQELADEVDDLAPDPILHQQVADSLDSSPRHQHNATNMNSSLAAVPQPMGGPAPNANVAANARPVMSPGAEVRPCQRKLLRTPNNYFSRVWPLCRSTCTEQYTLTVKLTTMRRTQPRQRRLSAACSTMAKVPQLAPSTPHLSTAMCPPTSAQFVNLVWWRSGYAKLRVVTICTIFAPKSASTMRCRAQSAAATWSPS